jgi:hypothetical protein
LFWCARMHLAGCVKKIAEWHFNLLASYAADYICCRPSTSVARDMQILCYAGVVARRQFWTEGKEGERKSLLI